MSGFLSSSTTDHHQLVNLSSSSLGMPPSPEQDESRQEHPRDAGASNVGDSLSPKTASAFLGLHARAKERQNQVNSPAAEQPGKTKHRKTPLSTCLYLGHSS